MTREDVFDFMNAHLACHLATVEGGEPRVRGMWAYRADEKGIVFHTGTFKDLYRQLTADPAVEFCFNDFEKGIQVRVRGEAREEKDASLKEEIVAAREFLRPFVEKPDGRDQLAVFRVTELTACVWTMDTNTEPKKLIPL